MASMVTRRTGVPLAFSLAADKIGHPLAFEPSDGPADEALAWNVMTWGQYQYQFPFTPLVDKYKWLETRHMVNISDRWRSRPKPAICNLPSSTELAGRSWENMGIWTESRPAMRKRLAASPPSNAPLLPSS